MNNKIIKFNMWFFKGISKNSAGYKRILNSKLLIHILIGCALSYFIKKSIIDISNICIIPILSVLIGITFAWIGNSHIVMMDSEVRPVLNEREGGLIEYLYIYQLAIFILLIVLIINILNVLGFHQTIKSIFKLNYFWSVMLGFTYKSIIFALFSYSISIVWEIITAAQWLYVIKNEVYEAKKEKNEGNNNNP